MASARPGPARRDQATQLAGGCSVDQHGGERPIWIGATRQ
jgi:hypothetical protein